VLGPCPSVYDCLWPSQSVGLPPNPSSPASYMPYKSECVCVYVLAFLSVSVCMFWLVFYYSVNQISCLTTQSKHLQHAPWTRTWTWPRAGPLYHPLITAQPLLHTPAHPHTHTHTLTTHLFHLAHLSAVCPGLRLAVIFTVKSICSRQKQHLILL